MSDRPCRECPFWKSGPGGWLGPYGDAAHLHKVVMDHEGIPCHMRSDKSMCVGAAAYMAHCSKLPRDAKRAALVRETGKRDDVVSGLPALIEHHERLQAPVVLSESEALANSRERGCLIEIVRSYKSRGAARRACGRSQFVIVHEKGQLHGYSVAEYAEAL